MKLSVSSTVTVRWRWLHHRLTLIILFHLLRRGFPSSLILARRVLPRVRHLVLQSLDEIIEDNSSDGTTSGSYCKLAMPNMTRMCSFSTCRGNRSNVQNPRSRSQRKDQTNALGSVNLLCSRLRRAQRRTWRCRCRWARGMWRDASPWPA